MSEAETLLLNEATALALWQSALSQEIGIKIPCKLADLDKIKATMWNVRKTSGDAALDELKLIVAPGGEAVWILKKTTELP